MKSINRKAHKEDTKNAKLILDNPFFATLGFESLRPLWLNFYKLK
jgi:hypothetical protein